MPDLRIHKPQDADLSNIEGLQSSDNLKGSLSAQHSNASFKNEAVKQPKKSAKSEKDINYAAIAALEESLVNDADLVEQFEAHQQRILKEEGIILPEGVKLNFNSESGKLRIVRE